jgi:hypothetical protein
MARKRERARTTGARVTGQETPPVSHEEIARYAYRLYEERGRGPGHDFEDWIVAERALTTERGQSAES